MFELDNFRIQGKDRVKVNLAGHPEYDMSGIANTRERIYPQRRSPRSFFRCCDKQPAARRKEGHWRLDVGYWRVNQ